MTQLSLHPYFLILLSFGIHRVIAMFLLLMLGKTLNHVYKYHNVPPSLTCGLTLFWPTFCEVSILYTSCCHTAESSDFMKNRYPQVCAASLITRYDSPLLLKLRGLLPSSFNMILLSTSILYSSTCFSLGYGQFTRRVTLPKQSFFLEV